MSYNSESNNEYRKEEVEYIRQQGRPMATKETTSRDIHQSRAETAGVARAISPSGDESPSAHQSQASERFYEHHHKQPDGTWKTWRVPVRENDAAIEPLRREIGVLRDQRRFEAACAAMTGLIAGYEGPPPDRPFAEVFAERAVAHADALLEELAKPKDGET